MDFHSVTSYDMMLLRKTTLSISEATAAGSHIVVHPQTPAAQSRRPVPAKIKINDSAAVTLLLLITVVVVVGAVMVLVVVGVLFYFYFSRILLYSIYAQNLLIFSI